MAFGDSISVAKIQRLFLYIFLVDGGSWFAASIYLLNIYKGVIFAFPNLFKHYEFEYLRPLNGNAI